MKHPELCELQGLGCFVWGDPSVLLIFFADLHFIL